MESTIDYLARRHPDLIRNYTTPEGQYIEDCGKMAAGIAKRLLDEGKSPSIMELSEVISIGGFVHTKRLTPLAFKDTWQEGWVVHHVCCTDTEAYDPIIGKPVPLEDYCRMMFGENIPMTTVVPPESIREFVNR